MINYVKLLFKQKDKCGIKKLNAGFHNAQFWSPYFF